MADKTIHNWLREDEGFRADPYEDHLGHLTIGYGRNLDANGITKSEADTMLRYDVAVAQTALASLIGTTLANEISNRWPVRYDALTNMSFQLGARKLLGFKKTLAHVRRFQWQQAAAEALDSKWARADTPARAVRVAYALAWNEHVPEED